MPGIICWFCSAAMDQYLPWSASLPVGETADSPLLPAPLTPRRIVEGQFVPGSVVPSPTGETDVAGGHPIMPDLSREGPFDVHQDFWCLSMGAGWHAGLPVPHDIVWYSATRSTAVGIRGCAGVGSTTQL